MCDDHQSDQRQGNVYRNIRISGGTSHLGDVFVTEDEDLTGFRSFLDSLYFPEIHARQEEIKDAHRKTFEWIFNPPEDGQRGCFSFIDWLRAENVDNPFWIQGKAGSGKSTLMRFIVEDERTCDGLVQWAYPKTPQILSFFFWELGGSLQKNLNGLLRSLLWQLFQTDREKAQSIWKIVTPQAGREQIWTEQRLLQTLRTSLRCFDRPVCLFLDGIDEISDPESFLKLLECFKQLPALKICVSSRPIQRLILTFQDFPRLRLQDLTRSDMKAYIAEEIIDLPEAHEFWKATPDLKSYIKSTLLERAQGVFLWLRLAINSIREGIENLDDERMLRSRLDEMPSELEALFVQMLKRAGKSQKRYAEAAAHYFQLILHAELSLSRFTVAIDQNLQDRLLNSTSSWEVDSFGACIDNYRAKTWVQARCAGLLEVTDTSTRSLSDQASRISESRNDSVDLNQRNKEQICERLLKDDSWTSVHFIHRTVKEFLTTNRHGQAILAALPLSEHDIVSDHYRSAMVLYLIRALVGRLSNQSGWDYSSRWSLAYQMEKVPDTKEYFHLFRHTGSILNHLVHLGILKLERRWYNDFVLGCESRNCLQADMSSFSSPLYVDFLFCAAECWKFNFLIHDLEQATAGSSRHRYLADLLCIAITNIHVQFSGENLGSFCNFLKWCFQNGVCPNENILDQTLFEYPIAFFDVSIFQLFLYRICWNLPRRLGDRGTAILDAVKLFVQHGANITGPVSVPLRDLYIPFRQLSVGIFLLCDCSWLDIIRILPTSNFGRKLRQMLQDIGCQQSLRAKLYCVSDTSWFVLSKRDSDYLLHDSFFEYAQPVPIAIGSVWTINRPRLEQPEFKDFMDHLATRSVCFRSSSEALRYLGWTSNNLEHLMQFYYYMQSHPRQRVTHYNGIFSIFSLARQVKRELKPELPNLSLNNSPETPLMDDYDDKLSIGTDSHHSHVHPTESSLAESNISSMPSDPLTLPYLRYLTSYEADGETPSQAITLPTLPTTRFPRRRYSV